MIEWQGDGDINGCMEDFAFSAKALDKASIERIYREGLSLK